jgi:hypothetical protein
MIKIKTDKKIMNSFGEMVPAVIVAPKSTGIFHKTEEGQWVKKVIAIREGLTLTGERKRMETKPQYTLMVAR